MNRAPEDSLFDLLRDVSRSFYLTLRVLPSTVRTQIGLAYLLARASDTIADSDAVPIDDRLAVLERMRQQILHGSTLGAELADLSSRQGTPAERKLLQNIDLVTSQFHQFDPADQQRIQTVFATITSGQVLDLRRFGKATINHIVALADQAELDDYTYRVAGCVGEFWTHMCRAHLFPSEPLDERQLLSDGIRFGKGLQLINILRDLSGDLRLGRCYLPKNQLENVGLTPADLLDPKSEVRCRSLYDSYLTLADEHLAAGWRYTAMLPYRCWRVRLACAWPILIGAKTLAALRHANPLDPAQRVKISRREVRAVIVQTMISYPIPFLWRRLLETHCARSNF